LTGSRKSEILKVMARRLLFASILSVAAAWAQSPPAEPAPGSVAGVVKDALTHAPLADVPVS